MRRGPGGPPGGRGSDVGVAARWTVAQMFSEVVQLPRGRLAGEVGVPGWKQEGRRGGQGLMDRGVTGSGSGARGSRLGGGPVREAAWGWAGFPVHRPCPAMPCGGGPLCSLPQQVTAGQTCVAPCGPQHVPGHCLSAPLGHQNTGPPKLPSRLWGWPGLALLRPRSLPCHFCHKPALTVSRCQLCPLQRAQPMPSAFPAPVSSAGKSAGKPKLAFNWLLSVSDAWCMRSFLVFVTPLPFLFLVISSLEIDQD